MAMTDVVVLEELLRLTSGPVTPLCAGPGIWVSLAGAQADVSRDPGELARLHMIHDEMERTSDPALDAELDPEFHRCRGGGREPGRQRTTARGGTPRTPSERCGPGTARSPSRWSVPTAATFRHLTRQQFDRSLIDPEVPA
jgi:hypothetical protein